MLHACDEDFPVKIAVQRDGQKVLLTLTTPDPSFAKALEDALFFLQHVVRELRRELEREDRSDRTAAAVTERRRVADGVTAAYAEYRRAGHAHRRAVDLVYADKRFQSLREGGWDRSVFVQTIKYRQPAPVPEGTGQWVTISAAADYYGAVRKTIRDWVASGQIASQVRPSGKSILVKIPDSDDARSTQGLHGPSARRMSVISA